MSSFMNPGIDNPVIDLLSRHRSIRKFNSRPVGDDTLKGLVKAAQCASTSHHVQAYTIIQVKDSENRQAIADLAGPQPWVAQAPVFLVFCADLTRLVAAARHHGVPEEIGWAEQLIVATVDTALVAQNLMVAAESMGLGGVFIGGIRNDPEQVCDLLNIPDQAFPVFGLCLGYPEQIPDTKPRLPVTQVLRQDYFQAPGEKENSSGLPKEVTNFDGTLHNYYKNRDSNLKDQTWTGQMAELTGRIIRPWMKAFLEKKGFFRR